MGENKQNKVEKTKVSPYELKRYARLKRAIRALGWFAIVESGKERGMIIGTRQYVEDAAKKINEV